MMSFDHGLSRLLMQLWLRRSRHSWHRLPVPHDSPQVHSPGSYADRVLIAGDGAATGRGVSTHELGLPGFLARSVSALTGRATDVDIVVAGTMTARRCLDAIADLELSRFDAVVLSVGGVEALAFTAVADWRRDLTVLLDRVESDAAPSTHVFVLSVPSFTACRGLPRLLAVAVDRQARALNDATKEVLADRPGATLIVVGHTDSRESSGAHTYEVWARSVAPHLAAHLAPLGQAKPFPRDEVLHEVTRQSAVDRLGDVTTLDERSGGGLGDVTANARSLFGTAYSAITVLDDDEQRAASVSGAVHFDVPRGESFCEMTIRRPEPFIVEDATRDPRYMFFKTVTGEPHFRFYAGYPIESVDGQRVGALCIVDTKPRSFTAEDCALLRVLALQAQERLQAQRASP